MQEINSNPNTVLEEQSGEALDETEDYQSDSEKDQNSDTGNGVTSTSHPPPQTQNRTEQIQTCQTGINTFSGKTFIHPKKNMVCQIKSNTNSAKV